MSLQLGIGVVGCTEHLVNGKGHIFQNKLHTEKLHWTKTLKIIWICNIEKVNMEYKHWVQTMFESLGDIQNVLVLGMH